MCCLLSLDVLFLLFFFFFKQKTAYEMRISDWSSDVCSSDRRQGERLGSVYNFMVNKREGTVEYAVMSFGGFLGIGESYHPLPWKVLTYDTDQGGYVVDLDKAMLEKAPSYRSGAEPRFDRAYGEQVYGYYGQPYIW